MGWVFLTLFKEIPGFFFIPLCYVKKGLFILFALWCISSSHAANLNLHLTKKDTARKTRILSVGGGFIKTSLNFFKNYQEFTYYNGYGIRAMFQPSEVFRLAATFSKVESVTIDPTWLNVKNSFFDAETHFLMHFADRRNIAYFIMGLSAQYWNGYYTGIHDLNFYKMSARPNSIYHALYFGAKMGMGAEIKIYGPISGYGEFVFRFTKTDVGTGLSDVVYGLGLKVNIADLGHSQSSRHHHSILHFRDKYHWF